MGELRVNIPNELHKELKRKALDKGISLKQLVIDILESHTNDKKVKKE
jgi:predicted HicB family RNase H-like nuclease